MRALFLALACCGLSTLAGAQAGLVADINPGAPSGNPVSLTVYGNQLCFVANDGSHGTELYRFDGQNSPVRITDLNPAGDGVFGYDGALGLIDNRLFFAGSDGSRGFELYSYNQANGSVQLVAELESGSGESRPYYFTNISNVLYFSAQTSAAGRELYSFDPQTNQVTLHDILPGAASSDPGPMVFFNNRIYFSATAPATGRELYYYDPASNSSGLAADINTGSAGSAPLSFVTYIGKLYFTAATATNGRELYSYDGTGVSRLTDILPGSGDGVLNATNNLALYNNRLYFPGAGGSSSFFDYLLTSYNLSNGARRIIVGDNNQLPRAPSNFVLNSGQLYFSAYDSANGFELRYLASDTSSKLAADVNPGPLDSYPSMITSWGGRLFFRASRGSTGGELFGFPYINTGLRQLVSRSGVRSFPNPVQDALHLQLEPAATGLLQLEILDLNGTVLERRQLEGTAGKTAMVSLSLESLRPGVYSFRLLGAEAAAMESGLFIKN